MNFKSIALVAALFASNTLAQDVETVYSTVLHQVTINEPGAVTSSVLTQTSTIYLTSTRSSAAATSSNAPAAGFALEQSATSDPITVTLTSTVSSTLSTSSVVVTSSANSTATTLQHSNNATATTSPSAVVTSNHTLHPTAPAGVNGASSSYSIAGGVVAMGLVAFLL